MKSIFISSTFKDMQAERDYLHEKVFPGIRRLVGKYGEDVQELDLRWGVDTYQMSEEESGYQVLRVCIDAIDRCKPYIIVLLGERYGWIPDKQLVENLRDERLKQHYEAAMSITSLEIRYGALSEEETLERCIFCFRDPDFISQIPEEQRSIYLGESPVHKEKLKKLKEQIRSRENAKIIDYKVQWDRDRQAVAGLESWGEEIGRLLKELLQEELAGRQALHPTEQYILDAKYIRERYLASYTPRLYEEKEAINGLWSMAGDKERLYFRKASDEEIKYVYGKEQCMHFYGEAGCGKSALLAKLSWEAELLGAPVILYFSGNPGCQNPDVLKSVLIYRLEEILGVSHVWNPEDPTQYLHKLDEEAKRKPVYCFIDALDQMYLESEEAYLDILDLCPNLFVITSALSGFPYDKALLRARKIRLIKVQSFSNVDKKILIQKTSACRGKKIDAFLEDQICQKRGSGNPLFLSLLLQRLFAMRKEEFEQAERLAPGMEGLHQYMMEIIRQSPGEVEEQAVQLFEWVGEMFDSSFFKKVTYLIAMSETGLTEREIAAMMGSLDERFSQIRFQEILYYLYDVFTEKEDGCWIYSHRIFYEAVKKNMGSEKDRITCCFVDYSRTNPGFMEREGYLHILKSRDRQGKTVLMNCREWSSFGKVRKLAVKLVSEDADAEKYFRDMIREEGEVEKLFKFWGDADKTKGTNKTKKFFDSICVSVAGNRKLKAGLRADAVMELWNMNRDKEMQAEYTRELRLLIPQMEEPDQRAHWKIKGTFMEVWNLLDDEKYESAVALLKSLLKEVEGLFTHPVIGKEMVFSFTHYSYLLLAKSRIHLGELLPSYTEAALEIYKKFPEYTREKRFRLQEIQLYEVGSLHCRRENPDKGRQYVKTALELARKLCEEYPEVATLKVLYGILNFYGANVEPEICYQYRYEALDVCKRAYQLKHNAYWQHMVADQAVYFAGNISARFQRLQFDSRDDWVKKEKQAWDLGFAYFEELSDRQYPYLDREYYEESLLKKAEEEAFLFQTNMSLKYAKKAYDCLKEDERKGWKPGKDADWIRYIQACALMAENLDDKLCAREALPYIYDLQKLSEEWYEKNPSGESESTFLSALQIAGRGLYHSGKDEEALAVVQKGMQLLERREEETDVDAFGTKSEFLYILARIFLKKGEHERARTYMEILMELGKGREQDPWISGQLLLLEGDLQFGEKSYERAKTLYLRAIYYWAYQKADVKRTLKEIRLTEIKDGKLVRRINERKMDVKTYFYALYASWKNAELLEEGMGDYRCYEEYKAIFKRCMEKVSDEDYLPFAQTYMFQALEKVLCLAEQKGWKDREVFEILCQAVSLCRKKDIKMERSIENFLRALSYYDLCDSMVQISSFWNMWPYIYSCLKEYPDYENTILPFNRLGIGQMWIRLGCFEEACLWLARIEEHEPCYKEAHRLCLLARAMCLLYWEDEEQLEKTIEEIRCIYTGSTEAEQDPYSDNLYEEITGNPVPFLENYEKTGRGIAEQEEAYRSLHILKMIADQELYFSMNEQLRKYYFVRLAEVWDACVNGNKKDVKADQCRFTWEEQAAELKRLTKGGIIWKIDRADLEENIFNLCRCIWEQASGKEEKGDAEREIWNFWRKNYREIHMGGLSAKNFCMLQDIKNTRVFSYIPVPSLEAEIYRRTGDKSLFLKEISRQREKSEDPEIRDFFEELLKENAAEWAEDFKNWILKEKRIWMAGEMDIFGNIEEIGNDPKQSSLYEVYRQYQMTFWRVWHKEWRVSLGYCGVVCPD